MKTILRLFKIPLFAAIMFFAAPSVKAQSTTYTWVPAGGNPYHISAAIVMSSPSGSADQFYRDFFPDSFLTYDIRFSYQGYDAEYSGDAAGMFNTVFGGGITWDDSRITSLDGHPGYGDLSVTEGSIVDYYWPPRGPDQGRSPIGASGSWQHLTPTPEGGSTMVYLIAAVFPLFGAASFLTSRGARSTQARRFGW